MGINYSLCVVINRKDSNLLLPHLCDLLDTQSRCRIRSASWIPEFESKRATRIGTSEIDAGGIDGLKLTEGEASNSYCFSLQIQIEREYESLISSHGLKCFDPPGSFGCMWTSIFAGEHYLLLQMTAATSGMSKILQRSDAMQSAWTSFAKGVNAVFAYIDLEQPIAIRLLPSLSDLILPDRDTLSYVDVDRFSIDRFVSFLQATQSS